MLHTAGLAKVTGLQTVLFVGGAATLAAFIPLLFVTEGKAAPQTTIPAQPVLQPNTDLKESSTNTPSTDDSITKKKDSRLIGQFIVTQLLIGLGSGLVVPYLNLYFTNRFSVSLSGMSLLIALGQIMTIVSMLIGPTLAAKVEA